MKKIFLALTILTAASACMPEPQTIDLIKYMVVQTEYNQDFVNDQSNIFDLYSKFTIRMDTMGYVSTLTNQDYITEDDVADFVKPVVTAIRNEFVDAGYTQVDKDANPDFAVNVIVLENFQYYQSVSYGGYGYPGSYYGYYGYYYPVVNTYYSNYVTLLVQVVSTTAVNSKFPIIWSAYIGDLNATTDLKAKTLEAVTTAFQQSSYLLKN